MTDAEYDIAPDTLLQHLARLAVGHTGADVERAIRTARGIARRNQRPMTVADLEAALSDGRPTLSGPLRQRFAAHEAGHAVAATVLGIGTVVSVTIGIGGGSTVVRPDTERDQDEAWLNEMLVFNLAGRAAELELIGTVGGGSGAGFASDLEHATRIAADMEGRLGYGATNPLLHVSEEALRVRLLHDRDFAGRVHLRIQAAEQRAQEIMRNHRGDVEAVAALLVEQGVVTDLRARPLWS